VNIASRLESTAEPDQIHISHETYSLIKDDFYCRPTGDIRVKGVAREITTFEVVGSFDDLRQDAKPIRATTAGFDLSFDPVALAADETAMAREALRAALAALEDGEAD
jgi:adenylate cyclase